MQGKAVHKLAKILMDKGSSSRPSDTNFSYFSTVSSLFFQEFVDLVKRYSNRFNLFAVSFLSSLLFFCFCTLNFNSFSSFSTCCFNILTSSISAFLNIFSEKVSCWFSTLCSSLANLYFIQPSFELMFCSSVLREINRLY